MGQVDQGLVVLESAGVLQLDLVTPLPAYLGPTRVYIFTSEALAEMRLAATRTQFLALLRARQVRRMWDWLHDSFRAVVPTYNKPFRPILMLVKIGDAEVCPACGLLDPADILEDT